MTRQLEAVFEHGVLRPLEPLALPEMQHVLLTITDVPAAPGYNSRQAEQEWLKEHEHEYLGQWVALDGDVLLSHGLDAIAVRDAARQKTDRTPLFIRIPQEPELPSAGLLQTFI
jgi:predicted DNA-binding antitoxin AbrB/MazE fold protein